MQKLAGLVVDQYDDVDGRVMRSLHPDINDVPDFVKEAKRLDTEQITKLADDQFAVILVDSGRKLKKFAMVDRGNTALSVAYLLKQAHLIPQEAVKVAASNLLVACARYGLGTPDELIKAANSGVSPVSGQSQKPYLSGDRLITLNFKGTEKGNASVQRTQLGTHDAAVADVDTRTNLTSIQGTNFLQVPQISVKEKTKEASSRYVDATGWDPATYLQEDKIAPSMTLLDGRYPVDGMDQVKTAAQYFAENWKQFHHADRRDYCVKLASRMSELGMGVPEQVERYSSSGYAADVDSHVGSRRMLASEEFHPALDVLLEKRAQVSPFTFVEALEEFDKIASISWLWDTQVSDPHYSVFGPSLEKLAEGDWTFDEQGTRTDEGQLTELALNGRSRVKKQFGEKFADEFAKSPKVFFNALPKPNKLVLARMSAAEFDVPR